MTLFPWKSIEIDGEADPYALTVESIESDQHYILWVENRQTHETWRCHVAAVSDHMCIEDAAAIQEALKTKVGLTVSGNLVAVVYEQHATSLLFNYRVQDTTWRGFQWIVPARPDHDQGLEAVEAPPADVTNPIPAPRQLTSRFTTKYNQHELSLRLVFTMQRHKAGSPEPPPTNPIVYATCQSLGPTMRLSFVNWQTTASCGPVQLRAIDGGLEWQESGCFELVVDLITEKWGAEHLCPLVSRNHEALRPTPPTSAEFTCARFALDLQKGDVVRVLVRPPRWLIKKLLLTVRRVPS